MLQVLVKKGKVIGEEVPSPEVLDGHLLIQVAYSCISKGTELSTLKASKKSLLSRAIDQPQKVKQVLDKINTEGLESTVNQVKNKLNQKIPIGYSLSGTIIAVGKGCETFQIGDKVAAAGAGKANHAEVVNVPKNLVVKVPHNLSLKDSATVTLGSIALHGVRRSNLQLGEFALVLGTGILGLLTIQLLSKSGIRVIATDTDKRRLELAKSFGAELCELATGNIEERVANLTQKKGVDAVLITASTPDSTPVSQAFTACKKKGKVVIIGDVGLELKREDMYEKELELLMSTSYGPGRYDDNYEKDGHDYPYSYVRWTENRNMGEYLRLLAQKHISVTPLIEGEFPAENADSAFAHLSAPTNPLIALLQYQNQPTSDQKIQLNKRWIPSKKTIKIGLISPGGFAKTVHIPNLKKLSQHFQIKCVYSRTPYTGKEVANALDGAYVTTNIDDVFNDPDIDLAFITSQHADHAELTLRALKAGKHVFIEKPLALSQKELEPIIDFYTQASPNTPKPHLMVGFNRRFSPYAKEIKAKVSNRTSPLMLHYRMNAGALSQDHWVFKQGGRMIGEVCHIIDLMSYVVGEKALSVQIESLGQQGQDNKSITLKYKDGSMATIHYFSVGNTQLSKEYLECHFEGKSIVMDNYQSLKGYGIKINPLHHKHPQKGHYETLEAFANSLAKKDSPAIPLEELWKTSQVSFLL